MSEASLVAKDVDHGAERYRRMRLAVLTSVASKIVRLGSQTVIVAITLQHLGTTAYGLWVTAVAALGWLSWGQAGLAPGLTNAISAADGEERLEDQGVYFTTALTLVFAICMGLFVVAQVLLSVAGGTIVGLAGPQAGVDVELRGQWEGFLQIALLLALLRIPLGIVESAFVGLQRVHVLRLFDIVGQAFTVGAAALLAQGHASKALYLLGVGLATELFVLVAGMYLVFKLRPSLRPALSKFDLHKSRQMVSLSGGYLIIQVASYLVTSAGTLILAANHGPAAVSVFALTFLLYQMASGVWMMFITGLWGALGEARSRGDWRWIKLAQRRLIWFSTACAAAFALGLAVFGNFTLTLWSSGKVQAEPVFLLCMALYTLVFSWAVVHAQILSALNQVWSQLLAAMGNAAFVLAFGLWLVPPYGATGLAVALMAACALTTAWSFT